MHTAQNKILNVIIELDNPQPSKARQLDVLFRSLNLNKNLIYISTYNLRLNGI
jgi:hypothetical protein